MPTVCNCAKSSFPLADKMRNEIDFARINNHYGQILKCKLIISFKSQPGYHDELINDSPLLSVLKYLNDRYFSIQSVSHLNRCGNLRCAQIEIAGE